MLITKLLDLILSLFDSITGSPAFDFTNIPTYDFSYLYSFIDVAFYFIPKIVLPLVILVPTLWVVRIIIAIGNFVFTAAKDIPIVSKLWG